MLIAYDISIKHEYTCVDYNHHCYLRISNDSPGGYNDQSLGRFADFLFNLLKMLNIKVPLLFLSIICKNDLIWQVVQVYATVWLFNHMIWNHLNNISNINGFQKPIKFFKMPLYNWNVDVSCFVVVELSMKKSLIFVQWSRWNMCSLNDWVTC